MNKNLSVLCATAHFLIPIFSLGYPEETTIFISHMLPNPRTLIALLARGLGENNELSPEQMIKGVETRTVLQWALEKNSYATARPISPLKKSSQIQRVVWLEKTWKGKVQKDAVKMELVSLSKLVAYIFVDVDEVVESLKKYLPNIENITERDLKLALQITQTIGKSEGLATPILVDVFKRENFKVEGVKGTLNTYCPLEWIEHFNQGLKEDMLIHIRLMKKHVARPEEIKKYRRERLPFILPLSFERGIFKPKETEVVLKSGFTIVKLPDKGKAALPLQFIQCD